MSTVTPPAPDLDEPPVSRTRRKPRRQHSLPFGLSATQIVGTALAATTATFAASYLGVAGTVIGAAMASVLTGVGSAVYTQSLRRTGKAVRTAVPITLALPRSVIPAVREEEVREEEQVIEEVVEQEHADGPPPALPAPPPRTGDAVMWRRIAIISVGMFVAVLALITIVEVVAGRPVSDLVRDKSGAGTSFFGSVQTHTKTVPVTPTVTVTVTPKVVVTTPTVTQTAPTVTRSPSTSASGSASASTSGSPTASPTLSPGALPHESASPSATPSA